MTEIIDIETLRRRREGGTDEIVIALDDALFDGLAYIDAPAESNGLPVRYVRASDPTASAQADVTLGRYEPSASGRFQLFQCDDGSVYEGDDQGVLYANGAAIWSAPPVAFGAPRSLVHGTVVAGEELALLFCERAGAGWRMRIRLTPPVARTIRAPQVAKAASSDDWLHVAAGLVDLGELDDAE